MTTPAIVRAAEWARDHGYKYMASVVKQHRATCYYHVVGVQEVILTGYWPPAYVGQYRNGGWGRHGVSWRHVPQGTICRVDAMRQSKKEEEK